MNRIPTLCANVIGWGLARNLIAGATPQAQALKLTTEFNETLLALALGDSAEFKDGIGDSLVVTIILGAQLDRSAQVESFLTESADPNWASIRPGDHGMLEEVCYAGGALGRLCDGVTKGQHDVFLLELSRFYNRLRNMAYARSVTLTNCLESAYDEIKGRKGVMFNGFFLKESDPAYPSALEALGLAPAYPF